jgi:hypothetical protein
VGTGGRGGAVGVGAGIGEEEGALALPVLGCDEAGDDAGRVFWCAAERLLVTIWTIRGRLFLGSDMIMRRKEHILLPICKWFVAEEPVPLSIPGIADCEIGVHRT